MNAEAAISWLGMESFNQWRLFRDGTSEKVSEFEDSESTEEALNRLSTVLSLVQPGKYELRGWKGKSRQAAQSIFKFDISKPAPQSGQQPIGVDFQEMLNKAKAMALAEFREEQFKSDVIKRLEALESDIKDLKQSLKELTDDDDENDDDAMTRLASVGEKLPGLMKGLDSMKGFLKK